MSKEEEGDFGYDEDYALAEEPDYAEGRKAWRIVSWIVVVLTLVLNLVIVVVLLVRRNVYSIVNKAIFTLAAVDLMYGMLVSPFYVENYVDLYWQQSLSYCKFYSFFFTFHDLFVPLVLILLCSYVGLKFSGALDNVRRRSVIYGCLALLTLAVSICLAVPVTLKSSIFMDHPKGGRFKQECRSLETYTMFLTYFLASSLLFCFTMSFLYSLCIVGSPFLKHVHDRREYSKRWRLMLSLSLVNILFIISGFLLNFKEISRFVFNCCAVKEPFSSINSMTYDIWSFVLLISEPFLRPLAFLCFYFRYLMHDAL